MHAQIVKWSKNGHKTAEYLRMLNIFSKHTFGGSIKRSVKSEPRYK